MNPDFQLIHYFIFSFHFLIWMLSVPKLCSKSRRTINHTGSHSQNFPLGLILISSWNAFKTGTSHFHCNLLHGCSLGDVSTNPQGAGLTEQLQYCDRPVGKIFLRGKTPGNEDVLLEGTPAGSELSYNTRMKYRKDQKILPWRDGGRWTGIYPRPLLTCWINSIITANFHFTLLRCVSVDYSTFYHTVLLHHLGFAFFLMLLDHDLW